MQRVQPTTWSAGRPEPRRPLPSPRVTFGRPCAQQVLKLRPLCIENYGRLRGGCWQAAALTLAAACVGRAYGLGSVADGCCIHRHPQAGLWPPERHL